ncbi:hypothetical protein DOY81_006872 [Sarcophaga bullata]|nr:hypothetical protein DOY81_006872 [Sarcophaga bullata]
MPQQQIMKWPWLPMKRTNRWQHYNYQYHRSKQFGGHQNQHADNRSCLKFDLKSHRYV